MATSFSTTQLEIQLGEDDDLLLEAESGWVEAQTSCDHLALLSSDLLHIPTPDTPCNRCEQPNENWLCLCCKVVLCSRYVNKHMLQHFQQTNHSVALSYRYNQNQLLVVAHLFEIQLGEDDDLLLGAESGWVEARTSCDHLALLASDLLHIPTPDTPCNRCHHPSESWLCLCCKDVLCSRFVNKHMLQHFQQSNHSVALSYSDLSIWCFVCEAYLDAQVIPQLRSVHDIAYTLKFGQAPPVRTVEFPKVEDNQADDTSGS
ncbi:hypothetical protein Dsin_024317 [Dipteronia sinensis]|uniref:UBP-type domain-containing protein n=1 Tax=Dipteronia sinensis TaxID=43782 RepID=A0AAE0DVX9_9ROSI|nr:hypothetical protein Dsin_024317 [Dipteronia sinensis]